MTVQDTGEIKLYRVSIATLQGSNRYGFNPREETFLRRQEGRPAGVYMDPWSKGLDLGDNDDNRIYQIWFDHDMNGKIRVASEAETVTGHSAILRCFGANREFDGNYILTEDWHDDFFSVSDEALK